MEREGSTAELAASMLGPLHTLKGNSGMIGFTSIKDYVHRLEEVFAQTRDGLFVLEPAALDQLFEGAASLRAAIEVACAAGHEEQPLDAERALLVDLLEARSPCSRQRAAPAPGTRGRAARDPAGGARRHRPRPPSRQRRMLPSPTSPPPPAPAPAWSGSTSRSSTSC